MGSMDSSILNTFLVAASNVTSYANFIIVEIDMSIKETDKNERKCGHPFRD